MENLRDFKINRYIFLAIIIVFALALLTSLIEFFTAFLAAVILYVLVKSRFEWLVKKKGWKKSSATVLVIVVSFFIILLPIGLMAIMLYDKAVTMMENPQQLLDQVKHFDSLIKEKIHISIISSNNLNNFQAFATKFLSTALNSGFKFFIDMSMMYFFLYFMLMNVNRMEAAIIFYLPFPGKKIKIFGDELVAQTFSNAVAIPLIAIVHGSLAFAAYKIIGLQEAGFWAVLTGFASILPLVGTGLIWVPVSIYMFMIGQNWQGFFMIGWGLIVIGTSDNVIRFLLAKKMADVHPVVTVLGVIMGLKYFGITGLIFGPLIISYFLILLKLYYIEYHKPSIARKRSLLPSYFSMPFSTKQQQTEKNKKKAKDITK